jgi:hypothetical protein
VSEERAGQIDSKRELVANRRERLWAKGQFRDFEVFRVPVDLLQLNPRNRRFRAEREAFERELGRRLEPAVWPKDERSVISLLLDDDVHLTGDEIVGVESASAKALREDWQRRRQEHALWIRPDGLVSNGNRRLAMLKRLGQRAGAPGYDYVEVLVLPGDEYDDAELFEMEAREQLTEGLKVRYSDLNLLLTLKDAAEEQGVQWSDPRSIDDVATHIMPLVGSNLTYSRVQLHAVRFMGEYLEYIERPGEYQALNRMVERFRDVGKNMVWAQRNAPADAPDLLELMFSAIQAGARHGDLRDLRRLVEQDPERFRALVREIRGIEDAAAVGAPTKAGNRPDEPDEPDEPEESDDADMDDGSAASANYPVREVKRAVDLAARSVRERGNTDAHEHVRAAAELLNRVDPDDLPELLADREGHRLADAVGGIVAWAQEASSALGDDERPA